MSDLIIITKKPLIVKQNINSQDKFSAYDDLISCKCSLPVYQLSLHQPFLLVPVLQESLRHGMAEVLHILFLPPQCECHDRLPLLKLYVLSPVDMNITIQTRRINVCGFTVCGINKLVNKHFNCNLMNGLFIISKMNQNKAITLPG